MEQGVPASCIQGCGGASVSPRACNSSLFAMLHCSTGKATVVLFYLLD